MTQSNAIPDNGLAKQHLNGGGPAVNLEDDLSENKYFASLLTISDSD